jgi:hypothetical protein
VYVGSGGPLTTIVKNGDPAPNGTFLSFGDPTISGNTIAFAAEYTGGLRGIFTGNGGALTTIAKEGDPAPVGTFHFPSGLSITPPSIAGDTVAFNAYFGETTYQNHGIFVNRRGMNSLVIQKGDPLFGSTVLYASIGKYGLDSSGSGTIGFAYVLDDRRQGIAFARLVPEPTSVVFVAFAATILLARRTSLPGVLHPWARCQP